MTLRRLPAALAVLTLAACSSSPVAPSAATARASYDGTGLLGSGNALAPIPGSTTQDAGGNTLGSGNRDAGTESGVASDTTGRGTPLVGSGN